MLSVGFHTALAGNWALSKSACKPDYQQHCPAGGLALMVGNTCKVLKKSIPFSIYSFIKTLL
jgi:hypothetical protein